MHEVQKSKFKLFSFSGEEIQAAHFLRMVTTFVRSPPFSPPPPVSPIPYPFLVALFFFLPFPTDSLSII